MRVDEKVFFMRRPYKFEARHEVTREAGRNASVLSLDEVNAQHIRQALETAGGKINGLGGAAEILGLHPNTLRTRMNKLKIPYGRKSWQPHSKT